MNLAGADFISLMLECVGEVSLRHACANLMTSQAPLGRCHSDMHHGLSVAEHGLILLPDMYQVDMMRLEMEHPKVHEMAMRFGRARQMDVENNKLSFISGLHMEYYRYHCVRMRFCSMQEMPTSLHALLMQAIRNMRTSAFVDSLSRSSRGSVLEAKCQHELYR